MADSGGGIRGQTSVYLHTADWYKRFFLEIGGIGGVGGKRCLTVTVVTTPR